MPNRIGWSSSVDNVEIKDISNTFAQMEVSSDSGGGGDASITTTAAVGGDGDESAAPCIVSSSSAAAVVVAIKDATTDSIPFLSSSSSSLSSFATAPPPSKKKLGHFREISDKTIADCIESLVGAAYLHGSVSGATLAANKLLPGCEFELDWQKGYGEMMRASGYLTNAPVEKLEKFANNRAKLEETIGYKFKNPSLLLEAFTHPTVMFVYQKGGCYQRLEFLGDAVLHFIITRIIFKKYPLLPPGAFSEYRSSLVSNQFLSVVSGRLELPRFMEHYSSLLAPTLAKFQRILKRFLVIFQDRFGDADAVFDYSAQVTGLSTRIVRVEDGDDDEDDHEPEEQTKRKKKNGGGDEGKDGGGHHQGVGRGGGEAPLVPQLAQRTAQEIGEEALQKIKRTGLIPRYTKRIVAKPSYITSRVKSTKFWLDFDDSPKAVADLYESMIGAVFIDSLDLDVVAKVVERTMLNPWMPLMGPPNAAEEHPVNELVNVVNSKQLKCQELKFR